MSPESAVTFATYLREARLRLGWTQPEAASHAGVPSRSYRRFEQTGQITLDRLLAIAATLGLSVDLTAVAGSPVVPNPSLLRTRRRGVRHPRPTPPANKLDARSPAKPVTRPPTATPQPKPTQLSPSARPDHAQADDDAVATIAKQYRDALFFLVRTIGDSHLDNYTVRTVVENTMNSKGLTGDARLAFVCAAEAALNQLNPENCAAYGINPAAVAEWQSTWKPELGIIGAQ